MMSMDRILVEIHDLRPEDLQNWIARELVRPAVLADRVEFHEIDVARIRLIVALRDTLEVNEAALPTVLSLLDQIYDLRRRMAQLNGALAETLPPALRETLRLRMG